MANKKVVLITGASSGIGFASALQLLKKKHTVYGGARRLEAMQPIVDAGGHALSLDVTDEASMAAAVKQVLEKEGRIDVLVNNAGYGLYGAVEDIPMADARRQIETNIFGLARMTQLVLPHMRDRKSGTIINLSSIGGTIHTPLGAWYHATKHAVEGFTDSMRIELAPYDINMVLVAPGIIDTEFGGVLRDQVLRLSGEGPYSELAHKMADGAAPGRGSKPKVIGNLIVRAVNARRPKTRYRGGQFGYTMIFLRRLLPDRAFDRLIMAAI